MAADPVLDGIETTGFGVEELLRTAPDLQATVPKLTWNVGEVGAHLTSVLQAYTRAAEGGPPIGPDLRFTAANNARLLVSARESSPEAQADSFHRALVSFVAANGALDRDDLVAWYGATSITARTASGLLLGELLVHGYDLEGALGQKPALDADLARLAVGAYAPVLALMVDPDVARGMTVTYEIRKAAAQPFYLVIEGGAASVTTQPTPRGTDCRLSFDPTAFVLTGRLPKWKAVLSGRVRVSGRRPWLAGRMERLLFSV
jgi:uncharacterized protein (TIGR03083 family)